MSHPIKIHWKRERKRKRKDRINHTGRYVLANAEGCDMNTLDPEEQEDYCWEFWERNVEFYDLVMAYYKSNPDVNIDAHEKDVADDSESDDEE